MSMETSDYNLVNSTFLKHLTQSVDDYILNIYPALCVVCDTKTEGTKIN